MSFRVASYNSNKKLGKGSITLRTLCRQASSERLDVICLQETGRVSPVGRVHPEVLGSYQLFVSTTGKASESTGFLLHTSLVHCIVGLKEIFQGRLYRLDLKLPAFQISILSAYFPTSLNDKHIDSEEAKMAIKMTDKILEILKTDPRVIIAGDFNEKLSSRDISSGNVGTHVGRFLPRLIGRSGFSDLSRANHTHTCFRYTGSSKLDRIICTRSLEIQASDYKVSAGGYLGSDHARLSVCFSLRKPYVPKKDKPEFYRIRLSKLNQSQRIFLQKK